MAHKTERQERQRQARRRIRRRIAIHGAVILSIATALSVDGAHLADWLFLVLCVLCEIQ